MLRVQPATRLPRVPTWAAVVYVLWAGAVLFIYFASRATGVAADLCPMHRVTGLPCPFCGGTRAAVSLAALRPLDALALNPLVTLALPTLALLLALRCVSARTISLDAPPRRRHAIHRAMTLAAGVLLLVNWAYLLVFLPDATP